MGLPALLAAVSSLDLAFLILGLAIGAVAVYIALSFSGKGKLAAAERESERIINEAQRQADVIVEKAKVEAEKEYFRKKDQFEKESSVIREELKETEKRLDKRTDLLDKKLDTLTSKEKMLEQTDARLKERENVLKQKEREVDLTLEEQRAQLLRISGMSVEEARQLLLTRLQHEVERDAAEMVDKILTEARDTAQEKSREIIVTAIQRFATEHTSASTVSTVDIPSDDMKGRVIGREGRNIRAFEKATGVDVIVDDTPGVVVVSAFDPVRREIARLSLERLIQDGRIHPTRIEEIVEEVGVEVARQIVERGKKAAVEANIGGLHRKQIDLLGRLSYRTSYGQNVLQHSIEVAFLCQMMADELGLDGALARRCGLLHDIGKAVDHEVEGGHPQIGADICKRFGERPEVLNAIAGHHGDVEAISPYTPLVAAADAISAARPGGRRESLERYIKRLEQLEGIANSFPGVKQSYAVQAGREVRVIVDANRVDDHVAAKTAYDIAKRIEQEMTYPGEVKVTLIREVRATEYAR
ncbi:MAG TPA: ribonuclease Y [Phycisphaerae bacterium]|jgi:ribonuclease Y|nr:ribonuclease Y [Phycisphaerae bacterium]HOB76712.1 ribonuclease Y [Phycisphaerae bacterium]HOJ56600.1 ribonuclease Y [Phycisphaerae bacterium]HOL28435.1 ribonuclease Y [Phycisphaerae bacterium]HPP19923.1 ribonuclease Y [Phycisphaerae bacterium]